MKPSQQSLKRWTEQEWTTSDGSPSKGTKRYLPKAAWSALSPGEKAATNAAKTHCPQGHPYEGDNLYVNPRGQRKCRECLREDKRRYYARRRADRAAATAALSEWVTA